MKKNIFIKIIITSIFIVLFIYSIEYGLNTHSIEGNYTAQINQNNYDIIILGSSMAANFNYTLFEIELQNYTGREIKPLYIAMGAVSLPYYYLIIKNRILPSNKSNIPIIIIDYDTSYFGRATSEDRRVETRLNMVDNESLYYSICDETESITDRIERSHPILLLRKEKSAEILKSYINIISLGIFPNGESVLKKRFTFGQFKKTEDKSVSVQSITDLIYQGYFIITNNTKKNIPNTFEGRINAGFFPEVINITKDRFPLIYIDSHMNPKNDTKYLQNMRRNMSQYLNSKNISYIDLNKREELNNSNLFKDVCHYNNSGYGLQINSRIIAEEIYNHKILA